MPLHLHESPDDGFEKETEQAELWFQAQFHRLMEESMETFDERVGMLQRELRARFRAIREKYYPPHV